MSSSWQGSSASYENRHIASEVSMTTLIKSLFKNIGGGGIFHLSVECHIRLKEGNREF
jgi:hypothetical protein